MKHRKMIEAMSDVDNSAVIISEFCTDKQEYFIIIINNCIHFITITLKHGYCHGIDNRFEL